MIEITLLLCLMIIIISNALIKHIFKLYWFSIILKYIEKIAIFFYKIEK